MTPKEYLGKTYRLDQGINSKLEKIESLNELATKASTTLTGMPRNTNDTTSKMEDVIVKIIDLQTEINNDIDELVDLKAQIIRLIKDVDNYEYQTLLEKKIFMFLYLGADSSGYGLFNTTYL